MTQEAKELQPSELLHGPFHNRDSGIVPLVTRGAVRRRRACAGSVPPSGARRPRSGLESKVSHQLLVHGPRHGGHHGSPQAARDGSSEEAPEPVFLKTERLTSGPTASGPTSHREPVSHLEDASGGRRRRQPLADLDARLHHVCRLRDQRRQDAGQDSTAQVGQGGGRRRADLLRRDTDGTGLSGLAGTGLCRDVAPTFGQRGLALAVEHDVDPREGDVSEQRGHQAREQSRRPFGAAHGAQGPQHAAVAVPAALEQPEMRGSAVGSAPGGPHPPLLLRSES